jgi:hypothetical protein
MKKTWLNIFVVFVACLTVISANCQDNAFKMTGQYRVRPEFRQGYKTLSADTSRAAFFITQRARLVFDYKKENLKMYMSVQDIRTWGDEEPLKDIPGLSVNELWVELSLKNNFSLKMGRQELVYDDHRLLGNADWNNATRSHDALVLKYTNKKNRVYWHTGAAFNQNGESLFGTDYTLNNYKFLAFSWWKKEFAKSAVSATAIVNGLNSVVSASKKVKVSFTFGPLYNYQDKNFKATLGAYYQTGKTESNLLLSAYMLNSYAELSNKELFAGAGIDYLSGSSDKTSSNHSQSFSTLYATNHKFYGYMDYFINIPADTKQRGLIDPYLRVGMTTFKNFKTTLDVHHFYLANENNLTINKVRNSLGNEFDLVMEYQPSAIINLQAGYSMMFATKNMELIKGGNSNNYNGWAFIMLKVSPTFLNCEIK